MGRFLLWSLLVLSVVVFGFWGKDPLSLNQTTVAASTQTALVGDEEKRLVSLYKQASPAVISIQATSTVLDKYLNASKQGGLGSGVLVQASGLALTNYHVVKGADELQAFVLGEETPYQCKLLGSDERIDIALLQLEPKRVGQTFPAIKPSNSDALQVGQSVLAIGNPFGLSGTLTTGIVSSLNRQLPTEAGTIIEGVIQTDAAINPGNSGGALLNSHGDLIGINTAIYSPSGSSAGIGFAVPINKALRIVKDLQTHGHVRHPWLGFQLGLPITPTLARLLELPIQQGVMLESVEPNSPAALAGLKGGTQAVQLPNGDTLMLGGDILTKVNGQVIKTPTPLIALLSNVSIGDVLHIEYYALGEGKLRQATLTVAEQA